MTEQFNQIFTKIMGHEGYYSNHKDDRGGETYRGISRVYYPDWKGWKIIDSVKDSEGNFLGIDTVGIQSYNVLQNCVREFYKERYYDCYQGDMMPRELAEEMFDISINIGMWQSVLFLQRSLNVFGSTDIDLKVDGLFGNKTLNAIMSFLDREDSKLLVKTLNIYQGNHYLNLATKDSSQRSFIRGWLKRVEINTYE